MLHLQRLTLSNCRLTNECVMALAGAELPALCDVDFRYRIAGSANQSWPPNTTAYDWIKHSFRTQKLGR
jgi:hypothetical protein